MSLAWRLSDRAKDDLRRIISFTKKTWGKRVAEEFADGLEALLERLAAFPEMGRARQEIGRDIRSFPFRSHIVFYRVLGEALEVAHVRHGARRDPRL